MPTEPQVITGQDQYFNMAAETAWGEVPGSPVYVPVPFSEYNVKINRGRRNNTGHFGEYGTKHGTTFNATVSGGLKIPLYSYHPTALGTSKSLGQYLLEWAFGDIDARYLRSRLVEWAQGPNIANKLHVGLRINQFTLSGTDEAGFIDLAGDVMGHNELPVATAQVAVNNHHGLHSVPFSSVVLTASGVPLPISSLSLQRQHGLKGRFRGAIRTQLLAKTTRKTVLSIVLDKTSDDYDDAARLVNEPELELDVSLEMQGLNGGTGPGGTNYTKYVFDMPKCQFVQTDDSNGLEELMGQTLNFDVMEPDGADRDLTVTYSSPV